MWLFWTLESIAEIFSEAIKTFSPKSKTFCKGEIGAQNVKSMQMAKVMKLSVLKSNYKLMSTGEFLIKWADWKIKKRAFTALCWCCLWICLYVRARYNEIVFKFLQIENDLKVTNGIHPKSGQLGLLEAP